MKDGRGGIVLGQPRYLFIRTGSKKECVFGARLSLWEKLEGLVCTLTKEASCMEETQGDLAAEPNPQRENGGNGGSCQPVLTRSVRAVLCRASG